MRRSALAKRYARALIGVAGSLGDADKLAGDLMIFVEAVRQCADLDQILINPTFRTERAAVVKSVAAELKLGSSAQRVLDYLVERDRIRYLSEIVDMLRELVEEKTGKIRAQVVTAAELPEDRYQRIKAALGRLTGRQVVIEKEVDPSLIGGVLARVGSVVYDGSIRTQLRHFRASMGKEN